MSDIAVEYRDVSVAGRLDRVSLTIPRGDRVAYLGRSGAGKTTLLKLINGLVAPTGGTMLVEDAE